MPDIYQIYGYDVEVNVNGDLLTADGSDYVQQRIIRRLLTNPGDYIFHSNYGAGLGQYIGQNLSAEKKKEIEGNIIQQILLEDSVAKSPAPVVNFKVLSANTLYVEITYYETTSQQEFTLSFQVSN